MFKQLRQSPIGDIVALNKIAGPTICCNWVRQFAIRRYGQLMYCETGPRNAFTAGLVRDFQAAAEIHQVRGISGPRSIRPLNLLSSLQHYPSNNCNLGSALPNLANYVNHSKSRQIFPTHRPPTLAHLEPRE